MHQRALNSAKTKPVETFLPLHLTAHLEAMALPASLLRLKPAAAHNITNKHLKDLDNSRKATVADIHSRVQDMVVDTVVATLHKVAMADILYKVDTEDLQWVDMVDHQWVVDTVGLWATHSNQCSRCPSKDRVVSDLGLVWPWVPVVVC